MIQVNRRAANGASRASRRFLPGLLTALCLLCCSGLSQRQLFHAYGASDGLNNLEVRCLFQDQVGFLWVGTDNGLFRNDGGHFRSYGHREGLADTEILSIAQSPDGRLWVGTNSGVSVLVADHFETVEVGAQAVVHTLTFDSSSNMYLSHDNDIMLGKASSSGSYSFHVIARGAIGGLSVSGEDVYFASNGDLWHMRGDVPERAGSQLGLPTDKWGFTVLDTLGNRWVRSPSRLYELPRGHTRYMDQSAGIPRSKDTHLYTDRHGNVFTPTIAGIVTISTSQRSVLGVRNGLPADPSGPMLIDREDLLWAGTEGAGLVRRLGHGEWAAWTQSDGLSRNGVWAVATDHVGNAWVGTDGGLSIFDALGHLTHSWTNANGMIGDRVVAVVAGPNGFFYAGTDAGAISAFNSKGDLEQNYGAASGLTATQVHAMAFDHEGRLWVVGAGGCFRSHSLAHTNHLVFDRISIPATGNDTTFRDVSIDGEDAVWIASTQGLHHLVNRSWTTLTEQDGLKSHNLGLVSQVKGGVWIGYRDALGMTFLSQDPTGVSLRHVTSSNGLHSDAVYAVAADHKGRVWVSTDMGVDVYDAGKWSHLSSENGIVWNDTDSLALHVDDADDVWIGTSGGLSRYSQPEYPTFDWAPPIVLTSITGATGQWQPSDEPVLPYSKRSLTIQYAALTYEGGAAAHFRYRLAGMEQAWTETTDRSVHFAALPNGHYVFEVAYQNGDGTWSANPARFTFTITRPWWGSWWFGGATLISIVLLASALTRMRLGLLEAQKKELENQVADRTAELVTSHRQLEEIAYFDMLTSSPNRRMFVEEFRKRAANGQNSEPFALLLIDLDHFKHVNDTFGHDAGDAVLIDTASRLRALVQRNDFVARLGGDEFAVLLSSASSVPAIEAFCEQLLSSLSAPINHNETPLTIGCSVGIARFPKDADSQETLYKTADLALYTAKNASRNTFCWYSDSAGQVDSGIAMQDATSL